MWLHAPVPLHLPLHLSLSLGRDSGEGGPEGSLPLAAQHPGLRPPLPGGSGWNAWGKASGADLTQADGVDERRVWRLSHSSRRPLTPRGSVSPAIIHSVVMDCLNVHDVDMLLKDVYQHSLQAKHPYTKRPLLQEPVPRSFHELHSLVEVKVRSWKQERQSTPVLRREEFVDYVRSLTSRLNHCLVHHVYNKYIPKLRSYTSLQVSQALWYYSIVTHRKCIAKHMINQRISEDWCTTKPIAKFSCTPRVQQVHSKA